MFSKLIIRVYAIVSFAALLHFLVVPALYPAGAQAESSLISEPSLGNYQASEVGLGGSITVSPSSEATGLIYATALASPNFKGTLLVNPTTGAVTVANAYPAGNYTVPVRGYILSGIISHSDVDARRQYVE